MFRPNPIITKRRVSPGGELLEGLLGVLAPSGHRGAESRGSDGSDGADHQGLRGRRAGAEEGRGAAGGDAEESDGRHSWGVARRKGGLTELLVVEGVECTTFSGCWCLGPRALQPDD